ncbi:F1F0-ATPsyn F [Dacryopinax primogenitus]|uniref:F1F0-ATPsyn F n=1 Tax=Dacryopinax primogenitus (strain DJM 731) TaxID=1858805 RepID=M5GAK0_DACPD|nr:F1F0-ATPsyn F [Dacryopinax primogenitus]EJU02982.1 F1F0-ATPsyn F [Dacryopinax primogenitus]
MRTTLIRRALEGLIPPKIASPHSVTGGSVGAQMSGVVDFYSKLPKGPAPPMSTGIKARYWDGKNASAAPIYGTILSLMLLGYSLDYFMHLRHHKNKHH